MQDNRKINLDLDLENNKDFEENSPYQECIISEIYQGPEKFQLLETTRTGRFDQYQSYSSEMLAKTNCSRQNLENYTKQSVKRYTSPCNNKGDTSGYLNHPHFKDLYLYLTQNKLPSSKSVICKVEALVERYILLDSMLFKLITTLAKETALLAIPEMCADKIITLYHSSLFAGHQGVIKTYLMIADKFFIPDLMHYLHSYIKGCHICQLSRKDKTPTRQ